MGSTFGSLNTAYTGIQAARAAMDVAGQNIANATTVGYTRQRANQASIAAAVTAGGFISTTPHPGNGVEVTGISRLGSDYLDSRVRTAASASGYHAARAETLHALEASFNEPGPNGLSAKLDAFWTAWQDLANNPGVPANAGVVVEAGSVLATQISTTYAQVDSQWNAQRANADTLVSELNSTGTQIAALNAQIRSTLAVGGSVNELLDKRALLTADVSNLAGGTVIDNGDGTVNVLIGGNALVSGVDSNEVTLTGGAAMGEPIGLEWVKHPGLAVPLDGGELAGTISVLRPAAPSGQGGVLAETAARLNELAASLASQVNAVHSSGYTTAGTTGLDFFDVSGTGPAALNLRVIATGSSDVATGAAGEGALSGAIADAISQLANGPASPNAAWSKLVTGVGVQTQSELQQSALSDLTLKVATASQQSQAGVDTDEEALNLMTAQKAYEASARVLTALDEMLDVLINRTGVVGR